jgi:hypothetical protein
MQGILFVETLFNATISGYKTQTRRLIPEKYGINESPDTFRFTEFNSSGRACFEYLKIGSPITPIITRYKKGEVVFLKEPYDLGVGPFGESLVPIYKYEHPKWTDKWKNKMFMPKEYARYFIEIEDVMIQRLHEISEEDAIKEGILKVTKDDKVFKYCVYDKGDYSSTPWSEMPYTAVEAYKNLWDKINKKKMPWKVNPWVIVYDYNIIAWKEKK